MIADRKWNAEALIQLLMGVLLCLAGAIVVGELALTPGMRQTQHGRFLGFVINTVALHIGTLFLVHRFLRKQDCRWSEGFGFTNGGVSRAVFLGVVSGLVLAPLVMGLHAAAEWMMTEAQVEAPRQPTVVALEEARHWSQRLYFGFIAVVCAPVMEETVFRGILYPALKHRGYRRTALWGTALFFALMHGNALSFLPLTVLGLALAGLYEWKGNLLIPVLAHATFNALNFFLLTFGRDWLERLQQTT